MGLQPDVDRGAIRDAYRRLARQRHPDRSGGSEVAMATLNEAYFVLGDPARRAVYDAELRSRSTTGSAVPQAAAPPAAFDPDRFGAADLAPRGRRDDGPVRFPWKLAVLVAGVAGLAVLVIASLYERPGPPAVDGLIRPGSCVIVVEPGPVAHEVPCDDEARLRATAVVGFDETCPAGTDAVRERLGRGFACIEPIGPDG